MRIKVVLPTLHADQVVAFEKFRRNRFMALRAGRRWGKTEFAKTIACNMALNGLPVGWFAPDYKISSEAFNEIADVLEPVKKQSSKVEGVIRTTKGGRLDFWTLDNERAGRSRKYKLVVVDEAAFTKKTMIDMWEKNILPTLLDLDGKALVCSNTNGIDPENFFYAIHHDTENRFKFVSHHAPTHNNPLIPMRRPGEAEVDYLVRRAATLAKLATDNAPLVYQQEYLAEFVDWSGDAFFARDKLLDDGVPVPFPVQVDSVFAIVDTASKVSFRNDGTAVVFFALTQHARFPLLILDWDITQISGHLLETWLPTVFMRCEELARITNARQGSLGAWVEDQAAGIVLNQQAKANNWPARPIDSKLTSVGKDARAINASPYVYQNKVKITEPAFNKVSVYKGQSRNHLLTQVGGFHIGIDNVDDDLLDCFTYGAALGLGNAAGF